MEKTLDHISVPPTPIPTLTLWWSVDCLLSNTPGPKCYFLSEREVCAALLVVAG